MMSDDEFIKYLLLLEKENDSMWNSRNNRNWWGNFSDSNKQGDHYLRTGGQIVPYSFESWYKENKNRAC